MSNSISLLDKIFSFFKTPKAPESVCPNCWGHQEYNNQIREIVKDQQIDINNHQSFSQNAFIQKFVTQNISGIQLKKDGDHMTCPKCQWRSE